MSGKKKIIGVLFFLALALSPGLLAASDYDHEIKVINMVFQWKVDKKSNLLRVRLKAKTTGWLSVGFNSEPVMKNADFIIGYVKNGVATVKDHFGVRSKSHMSDSAAGGRGDLSNISGSEKDGATTISFSKPLNSGDDKDRVLNVDEEIFVLLASGSERDNFYSRHKSRTFLKVNLATGKVR